MVNATFTYLVFAPPVFWYENVAFTTFCDIFTPQYLHRSFFSLLELTEF